MRPKNHMPKHAVVAAIIKRKKTKSGRIYNGDVISLLFPSFLSKHESIYLAMRSRATLFGTKAVLPSGIMPPVAIETGPLRANQARMFVRLYVCPSAARTGSVITS
jgi:hypothetical protein